MNKLPLKGLIIIFYNSFIKLVKTFWFILIVFLNGKHNFFISVLLYILFIIIISFFRTALLFYSFKYGIIDNKFILKKGIIKKINTSIPLENIQSVNIKQNFIHRLFNVASIEIDSPGTSSKEIEIPVITIQNAEELKNILTQNLDYIDNQDIRHVNENLKKTINNDESIKDKLFSLSIIDLVKIAISDNIYKGSVIVLMFIYGIYQYTGDLFKEQIDQELQESLEFIINSGIVVILSLFIVITIISTIISIINVILQYYNFEFSKKEQIYHIETGLINKKDILIPIKKIQTFTWQTNPIRKLFDFLTISITETNVDSNNITKSIILPGFSSDNTEKLKENIFRNCNNEEYTNHPTCKRYYNRFIIAFILTPLLLYFIPYLRHQIYFNVIFVIYEILTAILIYLSYRKRMFSISENYIIVRYGKIGTSYILTSLEKIQSIHIRQSYFMRKNSHAHLIFNTSTLRIKIPYIDYESAVQIMNYTLYKMEK